MGQNLDTAVNAISQLIQSNNLPFSIQAAHLGTTTLPGGVDFQALLSQEPSLEHFGGVTRGGTLVLLADPNNGTVIADFLLPSLPRSPGSSTCTVMVKPSDNLAVVLGTIANGQDAHICLAEGTYNLSAQLRLDNKGHLTISGNGKGTRIIAPGVETLFEFSNCKSISILDCSLENATNQAGIPTGFANNLEDLRGLLTILNCPSVELEKLSLRCAHQAVRSASCITVRQNLAVANTQVRIRHCDLVVGYQQIGILLVNVERSQIEDNKIQVDRSNSFDTLNALAAQPQYRLRLLPRLVANAYLGTSIPSGGATRLRHNASNVTVSFSQQSLRWKSDLASDAWLGLLNAQNPLVQTRQDLLKAVKQLARQILLDDAFRSNHSIFNTWYQTLNKPGTIIASQGIVVAGSRAEEVRILNNTLQGFLQGIHIGISPRATYRAGSVLLSGNRIEVAAPIDQNQERHGIYVSSCDSLIIENNYLQAMGTFLQPIEGIRVSGRLGRMVIIRQNHLTGFSLGIYFNPLDIYGTATMMQWFVSDNMASGAQTFMRVVSNRPGTEGTQITSKVRVSNNFQ